MHTFARPQSSAAAPAASTQPPQPTALSRPTLRKPPSSLATLAPQPSSKTSTPDDPETKHLASAAALPAWNFSLIPVRTRPSPTLQAKLAINRPGDEWEQEADRIADQVMRTSSTPTHSSRSAPPTLQRKCACGGGCEQCKASASDPHPEQGSDQDHKHLQRKTSGAIHTSQPTAHIPAPPIVHEVLRSPGHPLDPATRAFMEPRFGHDFSHVRVHTDQTAARSAHTLRANAYTFGHNIVFASGHFAPATASGQHLLAHEITHVLQQAQPAPSPPKAFLRPTTVSPGKRQPPPGMVQRDEASPETKDPWDNLNDVDREIAQDQLDTATSYIKLLSLAQQHHVSILRKEWIERLHVAAGNIGAVDRGSRLLDIESAIPEITAEIGKAVTQYQKEWVTVEKQYQMERRWLLSGNVKSTDSLEAAKYIDGIYQQTKPATVSYPTDEDYAELKNVLDGSRDIWIGALRGARIRKAQLRNIMAVVRDLRRDGEDANLYIPHWSEQVDAEAAHLEEIATHADQNSQQAADPAAREASRGWKTEFQEARADLLQEKQETLAVKSGKKSSFGPVGDAVGNVVDLVHGAVGAVAGIFIEAGKQAIDLAQIVLYFETGGLYEPSFQSDMAAAAEKGATTGDLLKGMVTGMIDTPSRFLKACKEGDWKAIGAESVNLYMLADTIRGIPEGIKKFPEAIDKVRELGEKLPRLIAETKAALRILGARDAALALKFEGRLSPSGPRPSVRIEPPPAAPAQTPAAPVHLTSPPDVAPPHTPAATPTPRANPTPPVRAVPDPPDMVRSPPTRPRGKLGAVPPDGSPAPSRVPGRKPPPAPKPPEHPPGRAANQNKVPQQPLRATGTAGGPASDMAMPPRKVISGNDGARPGAGNQPISATAGNPTGSSGPGNPASPKVGTVEATKTPGVDPPKAPSAGPPKNPSVDPPKGAGPDAATSAKKPGVKGNAADKPGAPARQLDAGETLVRYENGSDGLIATLDSDGIMDLYIKAGPKTPRGSQMFNEAIEAYGSNVKGVRGNWNGGGDLADNFNSFKAAVARDLSPEQAALETFTGKMASRAGFTNAKVTVNTATKVVAEFRR